MSALSFKMLFRKRGTASAILAVALLVAILASMNAALNYINSQAETLGELVNLGGTYLILSRNSTSTTNSSINAELATRLSNLTYVKYVVPQRILTANVTTESSSQTILVSGVEDVNSFLKLRRAYVNGTTAKTETDANIGEILAGSTSIKLGDEVNLTVDNSILKVKVVGIIRTQTQTDAELTTTMDAINHLAGDNGTLSLIEFALKEGVKSEEAIDNITQLLPENVKIVKTQQPNEFMQGINSQTMAFLNLWSIAVYAVVAAASYVVATRLIAESTYELATLKTLGAKTKLLFTMVIAYTAITALIGSILGIALGVAGTQTVSTILMWIRPSVEVTPFLEAPQALQTLLLTLTSSIIGCAYPAFKAAHTRYTEQQL